MTLYGESRVWLEQFPLGQPTPFTHDHLGLRYTGEVIRADIWKPAWGETLEGEAYFRIVLLRRARGNLRPSIKDPRIALCLPSGGLSRQRGRMSGELASIRETMAIYLGQPDAEAQVIRGTLQRRQVDLEEQLLGEEAAR